MKIKVILILCFLFLASMAYSQDVRSNLTIDTNDILIGERITLKLEVESKPEYLLVWPQFADTLGKLEILKRNKIDTTKQNDKLIYSQKIELTSFESGTFIIDPFTFVYEKKGSGNLLTTSTNSFTVTFNTIEIDTTANVKDIKSPIEFPLTFDEILPYILYSVLGVIVLILIYFIIKRIKRKPKKEIIRYDASIPADLEAIEALKNLENEKLWQKSFFKEYYTKLTDILRTFIHRRYDINSFEMTSDEILNDLENKDVSMDAFNMLKEIFTISDLAKFARMEPISNENTEAIEKSYKFINLTKELNDKIEVNNQGDTK